MNQQASQLERAREALDRGRLRRAFRHAWSAGAMAARNSDADGLEAVVGLASAIRDGAEGRLRKDAETLVVFASESLANARAGIGPVSSLAALFSRRSGPPMKTCPDCAEKVQKEARVCRFCGYRFDAPQEPRSRNDYR